MTALASRSFEIANQIIAPGKRKQIEIHIGRLFDYTEISIPIEVIRGEQAGPVLFVSGAIHGDEINGVEAIKRLLTQRRIGSRMRGTLIAAPIVNVFGFNNNSRYLPDRRDLNRCFPGSKNGSLGGRIAHIVMEEIVSKATHGIDLHTGAIHRTNLPQIRACLDEPETNKLAHAFGVPVAINATIRDGSLRQSAAERGIPMLLFEGGEALRYEEKIIHSALRGILSVMESIGMLEPRLSKKKVQKRKHIFIARSSYWIRAPHSGSLRVKKHCGDRVQKGDLLGILSDPYGTNRVEIQTPKTGIIVGMTLLPLVNNGDALFHVATFDDAEAVEERLGIFDESISV